LLTTLLVLRQGKLFFNHCSSDPSCCVVLTTKDSPCLLSIPASFLFHSSLPEQQTNDHTHQKQTSTMASTDDDYEYDYSDEEDYTLEDDGMEWNPVAGGNPNAAPVAGTL
jgi:hypothetical protein